jgi:release factor glutamine methyltransferase
VAAALTVSDALALASKSLDPVPELRESARQDAELLLRHVLGLTAAQVRAYPERPLTSEESQALESALNRRLRREPIQYITGTQEFWGLPLHVSPAVLIPRPETEVLVESVLAELHASSHPQAPRILDIGTGSGAIAIALARELPAAQITAVDLSSDALAIAQQNAARLVPNRIRFLDSDLLTGLPADEPLFDVIVSNPPYVPDADCATLHPQVRDYEPASALFAGQLGMDIYRRLIPQAHVRLNPSGLLALEFGFAQQPALANLLAGWAAVRFLLDLNGIPRVALARRS